MKKLRISRSFLITQAVRHKIEPLVSRNQIKTKDACPDSSERKPHVWELEESDGAYSLYSCPACGGQLVRDKSVFINVGRSVGGEEGWKNLKDFRRF